MHPFSFEITSHLSSLGAPLPDKWCYQGSLLMPCLNQSGSKLSQDVNLSLSAPQRRSTEGLIELSCFQTISFYRRHKTFCMGQPEWVAGSRQLNTHWYSLGQSVLMDPMKLLAKCKVCKCWPGAMWIIRIIKFSLYYFFCKLCWTCLYQLMDAISPYWIC